jgi:hypothetical protein
MGEAKRRSRRGQVESRAAAKPVSDGIDLLLVDNLVVRNLLASPGAAGPLSATESGF